MSINTAYLRRIAPPGAMLVLAWVKLFEEFGYELPLFLDIALAILLLGLVVWGGMAWIKGTRPTTSERAISGWSTFGRVVASVILFGIVVKLMMTAGDGLGLTRPQAKQLGIAVIGTPLAIALMFLMRENLPAKHHCSDRMKYRDQD